MVTTIDREGIRRRGGFTMAETLLATSISVLVGVGVMAVFVWCARQFELASKIAWSQNEAMRSGGKIAGYIRNAAAVGGIDTTNNGSWIILKFPDGSSGKLIYTNAAPLLRNGQLYLTLSNKTQVLIARGLMRIPDDKGGTLPFFQQATTNWVRVAYRVTEPTTITNTASAADDANYAASVRFGVCLRNATP